MGIQSGAEGHQTLVRFEQSKTEEECSVGVTRVVMSTWAWERVQILALLLGSCMILSKWLKHSEPHFLTCKMRMLSLTWEQDCKDSSKW